jgi:hypothetical protein
MTADRMSSCCAACSDVITSGGASRTIVSCVGLASKPASISLRQSDHASIGLASLITMPISKPLPLTSARTSGRSCCSRFNPSRRKTPCRWAFSASPSSRRTSRAAVATAQPSGLPPAGVKRAHASGQAYRTHAAAEHGSLQQGQQILNGCSPNVEPCEPGVSTSITS